MPDRRRLIELFAVAFLLALSVALTVIFNMAYLNDMKTTVIINRYGEAIPELLVFMLVCWPVISVAIFEWGFDPDTGQVHDPPQDLLDVMVDAMDGSQPSAYNQQTLRDAQFNNIQHGTPP